MASSADSGLGGRLRAAREDAGVSLRELASRLGVAASTLSDAEGGRDLRLSTLRRCVEELPGLSAHELLGRSSPSPPPASDAAWRSRRAFFGFSAKLLRWEVAIDASGERGTLLEIRGAKPLVSGGLARTAQLLFRGSPAARRELARALPGLEPGGSLRIEDACFRHELSRDRRGGLSYRRRQRAGETPPPGFGRPGALSLASPLPEGISLIVDLPAEELELCVRLPGEAEVPRPRVCAWADAQPFALDEPDLAPFLWPGGLTVHREDGRLSVRVPRPEFGLQHGLVWDPEDGAGEPALPRPASLDSAGVLAAARAAAGLSQRELSARLGVSPATISGLERGQDPRRSLVLRLLEELPALRPELLLPVDPPERLLSRGELWDRQRALMGLEADEEKKTLVVNKAGDAAAICESLGLRRVRPGRGDLRIRYASASGGRLPTELREIEEAVAAESEEAGLRARIVSRSQGRVIHEIVVPARQARSGVSYTRRLFTAGFFDPADTGGHDGAAIVPFHPVRRLHLSVTLPPGTSLSEAWTAVHPRVLLDGPLPDADLGPSLHPEGLGFELDARRRTLRLTLDRPLVGLLADAFWRRA